MTAPLEIIRKRIFTRITDDMKRIDVDRNGNWLEVSYNTIKIGRTRTKTPMLSPNDVDYEECLVLPNYVILLTHEEVAEINAEMVDD